MQKETDVLIKSRQNPSHTRGLAPTLGSAAQFAHALSQLKNSSVPQAESVEAVYSTLGIRPGAQALEIEQACIAFGEALNTQQKATLQTEQLVTESDKTRVILDDLIATLSNPSRRVLFDNILRSLHN